MSNDTLRKMTPLPTFSTSTAVGLLQAYSSAPDYYFPITLRPELLKRALASEQHKEAVFLLEKGATLLCVLDALKDGSPDALEYCKSALRCMMAGVYRHAENLGGEHE